MKVQCSLTFIYICHFSATNKTKFELQFFFSSLFLSLHTANYFINRGFSQHHEMLLFATILMKGRIPETFNDWSTSALSNFQTAVNMSMATLGPFQVPVVMCTMPTADCRQLDKFMQYVGHCYLSLFLIKAKV